VAEEDSMSDTVKVPQELKDIASFLAHDAGWKFTGLHYDGLAPNNHTRQVICRHGMPDGSGWSTTAFYYTTALELKKIAYTDTDKVVPVLIGVCKGGVLHYCDIAPHT